MSHPIISIIVPTFNRYQHLGETLNSLVNQTLKDWECLVVDDDSDDYTSELLEFYVEKDSRIKFLKRPDDRLKGANSCRNYGFENSVGAFIQWLDSDDIISENKLSVQYQSLLSDKSNLVFCRWGRFSENSAKQIFDDLSVYKNFDSSISYYNHLADSVGYMPLHSYLMSRDLVLRAGLWFEGLNVNQDGEFMSRIIILTEKISYSPEAVVYYRWKTTENTSGTTKNNIDDLIESWKLIEIHLKIRYGQKSLYYLEKTKDRLFLNCIEFPNVLKENREFFKQQLRKKPYPITKWLHDEMTRFEIGKILLTPLKILRKKIFLRSE